MNLFRAVCVSALSLAIPTLGQAAPDFQPRQPLKKPAVVEKPAIPTGRLIVKFKDEAQARIRQGKVKSIVGADLRSIDNLTQTMNLQFKPLFGDKPEMALRLVEMRAAAYSGKAQPDLAGMMYVDGPQDKLDEIARRLNALNIVEFVEYDQQWVPSGGMDPACGATTNDCFDASGNSGPYCGADPGDTTCCQLVCGIRPFCCNDAFGEWDDICADLANLFCDCTPPCTGTPPDRCNAPVLGGGCFENHPFGGCSDNACCSLVCAEEPFCCVGVWDNLCVSIAQEFCEVNQPGPTPDFTEANPDSTMRLQKYRTVGASADFFATTGYSGEGFDMQGLWDIGEFLLDLGVGTQNLTHGMGRRIAIIEHSAAVPVSTATGHSRNDPGHEDLANVICEPGQTPLLLNAGVLSPHHGTACLGIAVAEENGFGVTGIARHAQGYFFPIVSQEAGGRLQAAILSCLETFEAGDVMSFSIGPSGCGILVSSAAEWTLIRLASDLGITSCIAAGNSCCNLDDAGQFGGEDCGAIIVGACWPGSQNGGGIPPHYCRLGFSNFCRECADGEGAVHCAAWGTAVTTCGYGNLHGTPNDLNTQYTNTFNGTSAACPQIAALVACLQGLSVQFHGIPLTPEQIRSTLSLKTQCSVAPPVTENAPGSSQDPPCGGDFDFQEDPNVIQGYPDVIATAVNVFATPFFDQGPSVRDITVITGTHIFGNLFSVKGADNNFYIIESNRRNGGTSSGLHGYTVTYLGSGQVTDIVVGGKSENPQPNATVAVTGSLQLQATGPVILFIEFFNWNTGKFDRTGVEVFATGGGPFNAAPFVTPFRGSYVRPSDGRVEVRLWTLGFTGGTPYRVLYDLISVGGSNDIGPNPGGDFGTTGGGGGMGSTGGAGGTGGGGHTGTGGAGGSGGSGGTGHGGLGGSGGAGAGHGGDTTTGR